MRMSSTIKSALGQLRQFAHIFVMSGLERIAEIQTDPLLVIGLFPPHKGEKLSRAQAR
jgi:hypothetical protein